MAEENREPTMDEILASIKRIIAEDGKGTAAPRPRRQRDDILELTEDAEAPEASADADADFEDGDEAGELPPLVDDAKREKLRQSLAALSTLSDPGTAPQIVRSGETSLEGLVREMLRPMLKDWLDTNLPGLVEEMVAREIARITRRD